jgi:hypothetical protein
MNTLRFRSFECEWNHVAVGDVTCGRCGKTGDPFKSVVEDLQRGAARSSVKTNHPLTFLDREIGDARFEDITADLIKTAPCRAVGVSV